MRRRRIGGRSQWWAHLRALRWGHPSAGSYWFGCRWGKREGRISSLPNEMRTNLDLLDVGSTWGPFPEVAGNILTDLMLERNRSRKLDFRFTGFQKVGLKGVSEVGGRCPRSYGPLCLGKIFGRRYVAWEVHCGGEG